MSKRHFFIHRKLGIVLVFYVRCVSNQISYPSIGTCRARPMCEMNSYIPGLARILPAHNRWRPSDIAAASSVV